jgi:hypothetical protein
MKEVGFQNAYLTIYCSLVLAVLLSFCMVLIEGVRRSTIRLEAECVMDIGMNSILAEYHRELFEQYNLFYIDTSYGSKEPSYQNTATHLQHYLNQNFEVEDVFLSNWMYRDFFRISMSDVSLTQVAVASDGFGNNVRKQAIAAIQDDIGISYLQELQNRLQTVSEYELTTQDLRIQKESVDQQIQSHDGELIPISEDEWEEVDIYNPTDKLDQKRATGILNLVLKKGEMVSAQTVDLSVLASKREQRGELHQGNADVYETDGILEKLQFIEYLVKYCGKYRQTQAKDRLQYQIEYLITGKSSDSENLKGVVHRISAMREAANAVYLFADPEKSLEAEILAITLASAMLLPQIAPLLKTTILLAWAYAESLYDVKVLLSGGKIPILKTDDTWHYGLNSIYGNMDDQPETETSGLAYEDYLRILLALVGDRTLNYRFLDLIEMDMRATPGNERFRIDGCIDLVEATATINSEYGYTFTITRKKKYLFDL